MAQQDATRLLPAYLVTGTDELKRRTVVERLRRRVAAAGELSFNFEGFDGQSAAGDAIVVACNTLPFASPIRMVQVDASDKLKGADLQVLLDYLESPSPTTVLLLVSAGVAKNTRLYKAVARLGKSAIIDCSPIKRRDLPERVRAMARTHGVELTSSAANALIDLVGENTVALDGQLKKLALAHRGSDAISDGEVSALVSRTAEAKPWEFVDAFSERNLRKCIALRPRMGTTSPYALMSMCASRVRDLIAAKSLEARGHAGELARCLHMPEWRVRNYPLWARRFTAGELRDALRSARDAELAMKSGADPEQAFQDWYVGVIARPAGR